MSELQIALASLLNTNEHFLDYLSVTTHSSTHPDKDADDADLDLYQKQIAMQAVKTAQKNLITEDIPFRKPDDFSAEMFRPSQIMSRIKRMNERKNQQVKKLQQEQRKRMERLNQTALQYGKRMGTYQRIKMQKEIIERWKLECQQKGRIQENLPTIEEIEEKYMKEQKGKRASKDLKYKGGGNKKGFQKRTYNKEGKESNESKQGKGSEDVQKKQGPQRSRRPQK